MAEHVRLKNEFTEDEKYHNLMRWLNYLNNWLIFYGQSKVWLILSSANQVGETKATYLCGKLPCQPQVEHIFITCSSRLSYM